MLGGGFPGSVVLIGGDPGAEKHLAAASLNRLGPASWCALSPEKNPSSNSRCAPSAYIAYGQSERGGRNPGEVIASLVQTQRPKIVILDSIQVMQMESVDSTPGSVAQVRETASFFTRLAKQEIVIVLVNHITKGGIAGLRFWSV